MLKVGLTGGIGSGKSTVARLFKEKDISVIDADKIARDVLEDNPKIMDEIKKNFGESFFDKNGEFKRREFGNFIFKDEKIRKKYEGIIMPFIKKDIFKAMEIHNNSGENICVLDAPTLIENNFHKLMDVNILVWVPKSIQIERIKQRDNMDEANIINRINSQMPLDEKKQYVDFVIDNSESIDKTAQQMDKIIDSINILSDRR